MYSKDEEKQLKIKFWGELNEQLELEKGLHANKVQWMNFNTKIKQLFFRMEADQMGARLCIDIQFIDPGITALYYEQFTEFKNILSDLYGDQLKWYPKFDHSNGRSISRIAAELDGVNLYDQKDWPVMMTFLKENFLKLEHFWAEYNEVFTALKD